MGFTDGVQLTGIRMLDEQTKLLPVYFHSVGHYPRHGHALRPKGFGQHQVALCTSGEGVFSVDGKEYDIRIGNIFYFNPVVSHEYYHVTPDWTLLWLVFDGNGANDITKYFELGEYCVRNANEETRKNLEAIYEKLYESFYEEQIYDFSLTMGVLEILNIVRQCEKSKSKYHNLPENDKKGSFSPVIEYMKKHYTESVGLDDLVKKSKLSKNHFTRIFKKEYGVTPMVYLNRYRISVAKFLLTTTIQTSDEISTLTGFSDTSYFCSVFKKFEGCTPMEYRNKHKR